jgi:hypothetical protein
MKSSPSTSGRPRPPLSLVAAFLVSFPLSLFAGRSGQAWGDIAPPQTCTAPGQPCGNAGPRGTDPGVCTTSTCQRGRPVDGGIQITSYQCNLCAPSGTGGSNGDGGSGGSGSGGVPGTGGSHAGGSGGGVPGTGGSHTGGSGTGGSVGTGGTPAADGTGGTPAADASVDVGSHDSGCTLSSGGGDQSSLLSLTSLAGLLASVVAMRRLPRPRRRRTCRRRTG